MRKRFLLLLLALCGGLTLGHGSAIAGDRDSKIIVSTKHHGHHAHPHSRLGSHRYHQHARRAYSHWQRAYHRHHHKHHRKHHRRHHDGRGEVRIFYRWH